MANVNNNTTTNNTAEAKVTKRTKYGMLLDIVQTSDSANREMLVDFINREIELLSKKSASTTSKKSARNTEVENRILDVLTTCGKPVTIAEMFATVPDFATEVMFSSQKVAALLRNLVGEGKVVKEQVKKASFYSLAVSETETDSE